MVVPLLWIAAGTFRKSICERLSCNKVTSMHGNVVDFMIRGRLARILGPFGAQGSALTRNVSRLHGSKNLLQRAILYRHERISLGREDCRPGPKKTIWGKNIVFHWFLGMHQFVLAHVFCGTSIGCPVAVDCSGTIQKINMIKIR